MTNNEEKSRHEEFFGVALFLINAIAPLFGTVMFIIYNKPEGYRF